MLRYTCKTSLKTSIVHSDYLYHLIHLFLSKMYAHTSYPITLTFPEDVHVSCLVEAPLYLTPWIQHTSTCLHSSRPTFLCSYIDSTNSENWERGTGGNMGWRDDIEYLKRFQQLFSNRHLKSIGLTLTYHYSSLLKLLSLFMESSVVSISAI